MACTLMAKSSPQRCFPKIRLTSHFGSKKKVRYHKEKDKSYITMTYAIGVSDFKLLRSSSNLLKQSSFYIDKTLFIEELLIDGTPVSVFTRPRRFGKTLNLSMLKCFFDIYLRLCKLPVYK